MSKRKITDLVIDSTGLKVYGEGEWKVRQHGYSKRRTWRKLHLAICPDTHEILFVKLTDRAYDLSACYRSNYDHGSYAIIPPQRNGRVHEDSPDYLLERKKSLLEIKGLGNDEEARKRWKKLKDCHRRSLAETGMFRFKTLFGRDLKSRTFQREQSEAYVKAKALNIMTSLGMPQSIRKTA